MRFQDVIGQEKVKTQLLELVLHGRLSHALLFLGEEGSGALPLALAFAQLVSLLPAQAAGPSAASLFEDASTLPLPDQIENLDAWMQRQASFSKAEEMIHPDIHYSYPVVAAKAGDKPLSTTYSVQWRQFIREQPYGNVFDWLQFIEAENKQGNISAHECNDILHKLQLKSFESPFKILVMWMPEYLGNEGNKLLKLVEEPPEDTLFLFVAESESQILPTILSRTQLIRVPPLPLEKIQQAVVERTQLRPAAAQQIAALSEGNFREALQILTHSASDWQALLRDWLNAILKTGPQAQVKWVEEMQKLGREKQKQFLRYFIHILQQAIRLGLLGDARCVLADSERDFALRLNRMADLIQQQAIVEELEKAIYYIERNAHPKMLFHALSIKLYHIFSRREVAVL